MNRIKNLSKKHIAIATYMVANPSANLTKVANEFGISYQQMSAICNSQVFKDELDRLLKEAWHNSIKLAQKTMIDLAEHGDRLAAQYILDCNGYKPAEQVELATPNIINIKIE